MDSNVATVTITVLQVNDEPVANNDGPTTPSYTINEQATLNANGVGANPPGVLANDTDVEDGTPTTATLGAGPSHADTFSLATDGTFTYTPVEDYFGTDTFTYFATDSDGDSSPTAVVTIQINNVNDVPVAGNDDYTTNEDTDLVVAVPLDLLSNDTGRRSDRHAERRLADEIRHTARSPRSTTRRASSRTTPTRT